MTAKDKTEAGETPAIRDLQGDEIDSVSGGAGVKKPGWINPDPAPIQNPKSPDWTDPNPNPVR